ncbi:hypothetical protein NDU88_002286 [Pleurodeles waltl]|uniref:Uncharacterized protein n=1 Tax=Pleurodeles waltl TaxID=8319 RepID=A0AAV7W084_PLEWA|nr:hypothetical protein NDU88_002286 [Pleurodeles waltl]
MQLQRAASSGEQSKKRQSRARGTHPPSTPDLCAARERVRGGGSEREHPALTAGISARAAPIPGAARHSPEQRADCFRSAAFGMREQSRDCLPRERRWREQIHFASLPSWRGICALGMARGARRAGGMESGCHSSGPCPFVP